MAEVEDGLLGQAVLASAGEAFASVACAVAESVEARIVLVGRPVFHWLEVEFAEVVGVPEPADHSDPKSGALDYRGQYLPVLVDPWLIE